MQEFKFSQKDGEWVGICKCGHLMAHFGWDYSGRTQYRRYKCRKCGMAALNHKEPKT